jgi:hypothetical protein
MTKLPTLSRMAFPTLLNRTSKRLRLAVALALMAIGVGAIALASSGPQRGIPAGVVVATGSSIQPAIDDVVGRKTCWTELSAWIRSLLLPVL